MFKLLITLPQNCKGYHLTRFAVFIMLFTENKYIFYYKIVWRILTILI